MIDQGVRWRLLSAGNMLSKLKGGLLFKKVLLWLVRVLEGGGHDAQRAASAPEQDQRTLKPFAFSS